jgi:hypothetical protein
MKKLIPLLMLLTGAVSGFSQGSVNFQNSPLFQTTDPSGGNRRIYDVGSPLDSVNGSRLTGTQWVAELFVSTGPVAPVALASMTPVAASITSFRGTTSANKGLWNSGPTNATVILPGPGTDSGAKVWLAIGVWNQTLGADYFTATGPKGSSFNNLGAFQYTVPQPTDPPPALLMEGMGAFALVPEPSAIALSVLGIAGLLFVRRRK